MPSLQENQERMRRHESRPRSTSHRDDMVDDDNDYDNYRGKHLYVNPLIFRFFCFSIKNFKMINF